MSSLQLEIITPEGRVYSDSVEYVILPTAEGIIDILPGHVPLLTLVQPGEVIVSRSGHKEDLAVDKGFARVLSNTVSILTEAAINIEEIDLSKVEEARLRAQKALEEARMSKNPDPLEIQHFESVARFAIVQKIAKQKKL